MEQAISCLLETWTGLCRATDGWTQPPPFSNSSPSPRETTRRKGPKCADLTLYPSGFCKYFPWTTLMVPFGVGVRKDYGDLLSRLFNRHANGFPACESTQLHQDSLFTHCTDLSVGFNHRTISVVQGRLNLPCSTFQDTLWAALCFSCYRIYSTTLPWFSCNTSHSFPVKALHCL